MLVSFYIGVVLTFDYGFHLNLVLTALFYLPFHEWLPKGAAVRATESKPNLALATSDP
jgi:hypothetical protein